MAIVINTQLVNENDEYLLDAKNVKGSYVVVDNYSELANLPSATVVNGSLAYCVNPYTDTSVTPNVTYDIGFYQYNGLSWEVANIGGGGGVSNLMTLVTYSQFVTAINGSQLIPGMKYRITDYVTKINGVYDLSLIGQSGAYLPYATSAEHPFDLIVTALTTNTYDENVIATLHDGDTYFSNNGANIGAWELKWTHLNDIFKYSFADFYNGKGVITYMKDEFNNEAYYDFKNIQFLQFALKRVDTGTYLGSSFEYYLTGETNPTRFGTLFDVFSMLSGQTLSGNLQFDVDDINYGGGEISPLQLLVFISDISKATLEAPMNWTYMLMGLSQILETTVTLAMLAQILGTTEQVLSAMTELQVIQQFFNGDFYYTFDLTVYDDPPANFVPHYDLSTLSIPEEDMYGGAYCHDNKLGHCADALTNYLSMNGVQIGVIPNGLNCNTFQMANMYSNKYINCWGNTFGSNCFLNVFGGDCYSNKTEDYFYGNKLAKQSWFNCFKNNCYIIHLDGGTNIFGGDCRNMFIQMSSEHNCFGNYCSLINLLYCQRNLFGNGVNEVLMDTCNDNIIGNSVQYIQGNDINSSTFGNNCTNIYINAGLFCQAIFENKVSYITITTASYIGQFKICQGVVGSSVNIIQIVLPSGSNPLEFKANNTTEVILL